MSYSSGSILLALVWLACKIYLRRVTSVIQPETVGFCRGSTTEVSDEAVLESGTPRLFVTRPWPPKPDHDFG